MVSPVVTRLPFVGGTEDTLSTRDGGAMGTMVGTPDTKYGGYEGAWGLEAPDLIPLPASYTKMQQKHSLQTILKNVLFQSVII